MQWIDCRTFLAIVGTSSLVLLAGCSGPFPVDSEWDIDVHGELTQTEDGTYRFEGSVSQRENHCDNVTVHGSRVVFLDEQKQIQQTVSVGTVTWLRNVSANLSERPTYIFAQFDSYEGPKECEFHGTGIKLTDPPRRVAINKSFLHR